MVESRRRRTERRRGVAGFFERHGKTVLDLWLVIAAAIVTVLTVKMLYGWP